jgi:hypothetical protein
MTKGEIVGNIVVIDVNNKGSLKMSKINITSLQYVQDKYGKMEIVESIIFGFFYYQYGYPIFEGIFTLHI